MCVCKYIYTLYIPPKSSVTVGGPTFVSAVKYSQTTPQCCIGFVDSHTGVLTNMMFATWEHDKFTSVLSEEIRSNVIYILKGSLSAGFNVIPELIVKHCVQFITIPLVHIFHFSFPTGYFPEILKIAEIKPMVKKVMSNK